jgi:hypothetical protein
VASPASAASWLGAGGRWGTREQAIPGEWALLVLLIVLGAVLGLFVLWFTVVRHERMMRRRADRRRPGAGGMTDRSTDGMTLAGVGPEAVAQPGEPKTADQPEEANAPADESAPDEAVRSAGGANQRKLTDEILSRVESELAARETPRWKELAALVQEEFGVTVHPTSIQKAVKRRRLATETA